MYSGFERSSRELYTAAIVHVLFDSDQGAFQFPRLAAAGGRHRVATRLGGVSGPPFNTANLGFGVPDDLAAVTENRTRLAARLGLPLAVVSYGQQVHGTNIAIVPDPSEREFCPATDALITTDRDTALLSLLADCSAILLYAPDVNVIGVAHLGWRGTVGLLGAMLVRTLHSQYGADPAQMIGGMAPGIGPCCYEVGTEVVDAVQSAFGATDELILFRDGKTIFDIPAAILRQLADVGVSERSIERTDFCTSCRTDLFFSHRAERGNTGRHGVMVALPA